MAIYMSTLCQALVFSTLGFSCVHHPHSVSSAENSASTRSEAQPQRSGGVSPRTGGARGLQSALNSKVRPFHDHRIPVWQAPVNHDEVAVSEHCIPQLERRGVGTTVTITSQVRKLRHGEVKRRVRSHASGVVEP